MLDFLRREGIDPGIIEGIEQFRGAHPGPGRGRRGAWHGEAALRLLRQGHLGGGRHRPALRREPAAGGPQGHRQERAGRVPGRGLRPPELGRQLLHQHRRRLAHRHRHLQERRGELPPRPDNPVRHAGRLRRARRDKHGEERVPRRAARHAGLPPRDRRARLRPHRDGPGRALHRHHELRLRRHARAQRGAREPLRRHRDAGHHRGEPAQAPRARASDAPRRVGKAVREPLSGAAPQGATARRYPRRRSTCAAS